MLTPQKSLPSRELLKQLPKRFRLCWRKNEVQDSIKELRDFTADFNELTTRIINELKEIQTTAPPAPEMLIRHRASQLNSLEKYRQIRSASHRLYNTFALRWTCTRHKKHAASISLVEDDTLPQPGDALDGIKFDVAISCDADSPTCPDVPIWLEVESVDANSFEFGSQKREEPSDTDSNDAWTSVMDTMTKHTQPIVIKKAEKIRNKLVKKAVRFQSTASNLVAAISTTRSSSTTLVQVTGGEDDKDKDKGGTIGPFPTNDPATADSIIDLEMIEDFCRLFQVPRPVWSSKPVGYIRNLGLHRFYLPPPQRRLSGPQKSLAEIITWISEDEFSRSLPRTSMAHLASSLAAAVLQYHSTPWLPETWQSSHVRFFGVGELSQDSSSISLGTPYTPYFKVEFSKPEKGKYVDLNRSATGRAMVSPAMSAEEPNAPLIGTRHIGRRARTSQSHSLHVRRNLPSRRDGHHPPHLARPQRAPLPLRHCAPRARLQSAVGAAAAKGTLHTTAPAASPYRLPRGREAGSDVLPVQPHGAPLPKNCTQVPRLRLRARRERPCQ